MSLFSREQTRGLLYLIPILLLIVMLTYVIEHDRDTAESALLAKSAERAKAEGVVEENPLKEFKPNKDSYETLRLSGLPTELAVGIVRWRNYGKVFRMKEDLAEVSGMNDSIYAQIKSYIIIESSIASNLVRIVICNPNHITLTPKGLIASVRLSCPQNLS